MTLSVIIGYLLIIAFLGYLGYRKTHGVSDYLLAGRQIHPYVMALSYGATFISTAAIVGFGGAAGIFGMGLLWLTFLNIFVGIFIAFVFFGKRTRRMGYNLEAHTFPEFLARRFDSPFIQKFSGAVIFIFMPLYAAVVLIGAAKFIEHQFAIDFTASLFFFTLIVATYVIMGGLKGVMYTDAFQGTVMFLGMFILIIYTYHTLGGVTNAHQALTDLQVPPPLAAQGHEGWTSMPSLGSDLWWALVSTLIMGVGIGVLAQPQLIVRFMTVRSNRELNRAVLIGGVFILMMTGVAFVGGSLSNVFFAKNVAGLEFCEYTRNLTSVCPETAVVEIDEKNIAKFRAEHPGIKTGDSIDIHEGKPHKITKEGSISLIAAGGNVSDIIPQYIRQSMPVWFSVLFMITLVAAAMSTLSSQFHTLGASLGHDIYQQVRKGKEFSEERSVFFTKMGVGITILLSALLAYYLPLIFDKGEAIIARGTAIFFGICASSFLPAYIGGLYFKKMTKAGAISGIIGGFSVSFLWLLFVNQSVSSVLGLSNYFFGKPSLFGVPWAVMDPLFIGLPTSAFLTIVVSCLTKKPSEEHINNCFKNV